MKQLYDPPHHLSTRWDQQRIKLQLFKEALIEVNILQVIILQISYDVNDDCVHGASNDQLGLAADGEKH